MLFDRVMSGESAVAPMHGSESLERRKAYFEVVDLYKFGFIGTTGSFSLLGERVIAFMTESSPRISASNIPEGVRVARAIAV